MPSTRRRSVLTLAGSILVPVTLVTAVAFAVTAQAATDRTGTGPSDGTELVASREPAPDGPVPTAPVPEVLAPRSVRLVLTPATGAGLARYAEPGAPVPAGTLPSVNELGSPLVLLAVEQLGDWYRALLPTRPNGSTAWIRAADVVATAPSHRAELSRATHTLRVVRSSDDAVVLTSPVGFGKPSSPTPPGEYFVRDHFPTGTLNHPYGPFAFGLSGHSEVYERFGTGDGRLAIHGTNQPETIGIDASNGCPHVPNDVVLDLIPYLPLGTPVVIV